MNPLVKWHPCLPFIYSNWSSLLLWFIVAIAATWDIPLCSQQSRRFGRFEVFSRVRSFWAHSAFHPKDSGQISGAGVAWNAARFFRFCSFSIWEKTKTLCHWENDAHIELEEILKTSGLLKVILYVILMYWSTDLRIWLKHTHLRVWHPEVTTR